MREMTRETLFVDDALIKYADGTPVDALRHTFTGVHGNKDIPRAAKILRLLRADVDADYLEEYGVVMDTFALREEFSVTQHRFWDDPRIDEALEALRLSPDDKKDIPIPWWNVVGCAEADYTPAGAGGHTVLKTRHSYETQLVRSGHELGIISVSGGAIPITKPEDDFPDGKIVIGLRGGATLPNIYHFFAGALKATDELTDGSSSIYEAFLGDEMLAETGLSERNIESDYLASRVMDYSIEVGPTYFFGMHLNVGEEEFTNIWQNNRNTDKQEHSGLMYIPNDSDAIGAFIRKHYVGICANRVDRTFEERHLMHPAALALSAMGNVPFSELKGLFREGLH